MVTNIKCPCEQCILFAMCINKEILPLLKECEHLSTFLIKNQDSNTKYLYMGRLSEFCSIMNIRLRKGGNTYFLKYRWQEINL